MNRRHVVGRTVSFVLLGALALTAIPTVGALAGNGGTTCRVRNVTQDTQAQSFNRMVRDAHDGDRLRVRGRCPAHVSIYADIIILGVGSPRPVLTGRQRHRVLRVGPHARVVLRNLVIAGGHEYSAGFGGAIWNRGTLLLRDSVVRDNRALGSGAIVNEGTMTLRDAVIRNNGAASGDGGGIANMGTMTVLDSVVEGNEAYWDGFDVYPSGGGIFNAGTLTLRGSTVRGNSADQHGGGIHNQGNLTLELTRVTGNRSRAGGGISNNWGATVTLRSSQVKGNTATGSGGGIWNGFWSPWEETEPEGAVSAVTLIDSVVGSNTAVQGGGIWNDDDAGGGDGTVALDDGSSVAANDPDDCVGTPAC